jgi:DTW domain-containing protein
VLFLQHPREQSVAIGTAKMASLSLVGSELEVGVDFSSSALLEHALTDHERPAVLLFPGPDARDITNEPPEGLVRLIVIDGTWPQAKQIVRRNPRLASLPRYAFTPPAPSAYTIRREPREDYVSTLESIAYVLSVLERDPSLRDALTAPFAAMVAKQVEYAKTVQSARHRKRTKKEPKEPPLPELLDVPSERLVCVVAGANCWPSGTPRRPEGEPGELAHLVAVRGTGEVLDVLERPAELAPRTAEHLELPAELLDAAPARAVRTSWLDFVRPDDVVVTWGTHALEVLERAGLDVPEHRVDVRRVARAITNGRAGALEQFCNVVPRVSARGRTGRRAALLDAWAAIRRSRLEVQPFGTDATP